MTTAPATPNQPWQDCVCVLEAGQLPPPARAWDAFYTDLRAELWPRLAEWLDGNAFTGHGPANDLDRRVPPDWPRGSSQRHAGVREGYFEAAALVLINTTKPGFVSVLPHFCRADLRIPLTIEQTDVWPDRLQATVRATWGELKLSFYNTDWLNYFHCYTKGRRIEFALTGLALGAVPASMEPIRVVEPAWLDAMLEASPDGFAYEVDADGRRVVVLHPDGMAAFLPSQADPTVVEIRGTARTVQALPPFLGQPMWLANVVVARDDRAPEGSASELAIDVVMTQFVWGEDRAAPMAGQDISARVWLQGCLTGL